MQLLVYVEVIGYIALIVYYVALVCRFHRTTYCKRDWQCEEITIFWLPRLSFLCVSSGAKNEWRLLPVDDNLIYLLRAVMLETSNIIYALRQM